VRREGLARAGASLLGGGRQTGRALSPVDAATGAPLQTLKGHTYLVKSVAFSPDGKQVVSRS
jgi:WD40 repeat protein